MIIIVYSSIEMKQVKNSIKYIRGNLSYDLWVFTQEKVDYLREDEWTGNATKKLIDFENKILDTMTTLGWDGTENAERLQWTRMGALFYSIIVITTIGNYYFVCLFLLLFYNMQSLF